MATGPVLGHLLHAAVLAVGGLGILALQAPRAADALGLLRAPAGAHDVRVAELRRRAASGSLAVLERPEPLRDGERTTTAYAAPAATWAPVAATAGLAAGGAHLGVAPLHAAEPALAVLFALAGLAQAAWAMALLGLLPFGRPALRASGVAVHGACLLAWLLSRTTGLPLGLHGGAPQPVGPLDLAAAAWAAVALAWCARPGRSEPGGLGRRADRAWSPHAWLWLGACTVVLTTLTLGGHA